MIVFDNLIEDLPVELFGDRPSGKVNNPKAEMHEFLKNNEDFKIENKLVLSIALEGILVAKISFELIQ